MIKVFLCFQDNSVGYRKLPSKKICVKNEEEFWKRYNSQNEYIRCDDEGAFSVYLKKDKIIDIWIEKAVEDKQ